MRAWVRVCVCVRDMRACGVGVRAFVACEENTLVCVCEVCVRARGGWEVGVHVGVSREQCV